MKALRIAWLGQDSLSFSPVPNILGLCEPLASTFCTGVSQLDEILILGIVSLGPDSSVVGLVTPLSESPEFGIRRLRTDHLRRLIRVLER